MFKEEHNLFQKLLSGDLNINKEEFNKTKTDNLVKLVSSHQMLPTLYKKIYSGNYSSYFEKDFTDYLKKIYLINKSRNKELLKEAKVLSELLNENKIKHLFLKGAALLLSGVYSDIGERMIGDIDFLISDENIEKVSEILKLSKFFPYSNDVYIYYRHIPRLIKKGHIFAIEPHIKLVDKKRIICEKNLLIKNNNFNYPSYNDMLLHNIYNFQINDMGYSKLNFSYKSFYDSMLLLKKINSSKINMNLDKYVKEYFILMSEKNLFDSEINLTNNRMRKILRYYLSKNKALYNYYIKFIMSKKRVKIFIRQILVLLKNSKYRQYVAKKIFSKLN